MGSIPLPATPPRAKEERIASVRIQKEEKKKRKAKKKGVPARCGEKTKP